MRVADALVPQIANSFATTPGKAAIVATAFSLAYGICQLAWGPLGDRFGKYRIITMTTAVSAVLVAAPAFARTLGQLGLLRALGGTTASAVIPLSMAFIGDHVPYEGRQAVLARFLTGQILGVVAGQALGGVLGDFVDWRGVFVIIGGIYAVVAVWLVVELRSPALPRPILAPARGPLRLAVAYGELLRRPWARVVLVTVFLEGATFFGGLAFVGAYAHEIFGLSYGKVGMTLAFFGVGGFIYATSAGGFIRRLGERGLAAWGGTIMALGFVLLLVASRAAMLPVAMVALGLGFYMLHNTLQTNATQMAPDARGLAVSTFACALFLGQAIGAAVIGQLVDHVGYAPAFALAAAALICIGFAFAARIKRRTVTT